MFVLRVVQVLLILQQYITTTYSEDATTNLVNSTDFHSDSTQVHNKTLTIVEIGDAASNLTETNSAVFIEGDSVNLKIPTSTTSSPPIATTTRTQYGREGEVSEVDYVNTISQVDGTGNNLTKATSVPTLHVVNSPATENSVTLSTASDAQVPDNHNKTLLKKPNSTDNNVDFDKILSQLHFSSTPKTTTTVATSTTPTVKPKKPTVTIDGDNKTLVKKPNSTNNNVDFNKIHSQLHFSSTPKTTVTTVTTSTTAKVKPKKPTVTIDSDDEQSEALGKPNTNNSTPKVPTIELYEENKEHSNKSAFVIPIVAVILSVPLVAIVGNVLYKRGKEWWIHRHYSRMDFLIDGMYNN